MHNDLINQFDKFTDFEELFTRYILCHHLENIDKIEFITNTVNKYCRIVKKRLKKNKKYNNDVDKMEYIYCCIYEFLVMKGFKFTKCGIKPFFIKYILKEIAFNMLKYFENTCSKDIYNYKFQKEVLYVVVKTISKSLYLKLGILYRNKSFKNFSYDLKEMYLLINIQLNDLELINSNLYDELFNMQEDIRINQNRFTPVIRISRNKKLKFNIMRINIRNTVFEIEIPKSYTVNEKIKFIIAEVKKNLIKRADLFKVPEALMFEIVESEISSSDLFFQIDVFQLSDIICNLEKSEIYLDMTKIVEYLTELSKNEKDADVLSDKLIEKLTSK